jgi:hypothetical protein
MEVMNENRLTDEQIAAHLADAKVGVEDRGHGCELSNVELVAVLDELQQRRAEVTELRLLVIALAKHLLAYAGDDVEEMPMLEGDEGRLVMVHAKTCGGSCDYGCGAVAIMSSGVDDELQIEDVECGTIRARELARDA